ncbi:hypothetical protein LSAT2_030236 [Lamellibrachia satsuma]|nr:hypothetical protein LSAT2_030236 [Lamellibrachia satsuma]
MSQVGHCPHKSLQPGTCFVLTPPTVLFAPQKKKPEPLMEPIKSAFGTTEDETGGATLKFESPLDDITTVDLRLLRRIVLRSIELLHYANKWERLVDIAYRFTAITGSRYAELVLPVMIYTQRKLIERIAEHDGCPPPQPHFSAAMETLGGRPITPHQYINLQLKMHLLKEDMSVIDVLGMQIDPEGHDLYQGAKSALKQCCVPLDVNYSLRLLREALGDSQYTARALNHSRQLLSLYLAGQTSVTFAAALPVDSIYDSHAQSRVEFIPNTARPQAAMPVDLTQEEFHFTDDIENVSFPSSQINVVIASYRNTIEMLLAADKMELAAEAMHELGNLHFHINDVRAAYKWWADVLDALLGTRDAIHCWRGTLSGVPDTGQWLLAKCGLWGCLLGGVVASNIAQ